MENELDELRLEIQRLSARLKESEKRYSFLTDDSPLPVIVTEFESGRLLYANQPALAALEINTEEKNRHFVPDFHADPLQRKRQHETLQQYGRIYSDEIQLRTSTGTHFWALITSNLISYEGEKAVFSTFMNIDARKKVEEENSFLQEKFYKAFYTSPDSININRLSDGMYVDVNEGFTRMTGYQPADVLGKTSVEINIWGDIADRNRLIQGLLEHGKVNNLEAEFRKNDGTLITGIMSAAVITIKGEQCLISMTRDISARKKMEEELKHHEEQLRMLIEGSEDLILLQDLDGKYLYYSGPEKYKVTPEMVLGKYPSDFHNPADAARIMKNIYRVASSGEGIVEESQLTWNEEALWFLDEVYPLRDSAGQITAIATISRNITQKKELELELKRALDRSEESDKLKSSLLLNMSHEFRTPMTGILGMSSLLRDMLKSPEEQSMVENIILSAKRLMNTLNSVLEFSQIESTTASLVFQPVDFVEIIKHSASEYKNQAAQKGITFSFSLPEIPLFVNANDKILRQVAGNLIDNAVKFTDTGSISIEMQTDQEMVQFTVTDTGIGIAEHLQQKIFEEFRQASEGLSRIYEGTGLGLTIVKKFVEILKGTITVKSRINEGSSFIISLPLHSAGQKTCAAAIPLDIPGASMKKKSENTQILLVEDNLINKTVTEVYLKKICRLDHAPDGISAIRMVQQKQYELILMDINLGPGMNGVEVTREIRKIAGYQNTPVMALTGYAMESDRAAFEQAGLTHFLPKPFEKEEIVAKVSAILNN